ncbi:AMP-binding protein [Kitasatospora sp. McL0602]|uniref:AMP-binding protein n=1 Tax=Kitasatospora sp. McL0602 TaxID=3439530 RepID=UPI003F8987D1
MTRNPTDPGPPVPSEETPVRRFRAVVARSGDRLAVHGPTGSWTYRELDAVSDALATRLRAAAAPGARIALMYGPGIELVAAVLAVLKAGSAYLLLDPQQSPAQLSATVAATGPALVLADAAHAGAAERPADGRPVLAADDDGPAPPSREPSREPADSPDALACLRPPGGAGGAPQGRTNRDVLAQALRFADRLGLTPEDRVPLLTRAAFDGPAPELFGALLSGASLHVVNPRAAPQATMLGELVRHRATVLPCTPALLRLFLVQSAAGAPVPELRAVVLGGEEPTERDMAGVAQHFAGADLVNTFGSEASGTESGPDEGAPAEAEVLLRAHPTVRHAAVLADPDGPPGHRLIGYLTSPGPQAAAPEELLRYLHSLLPEYAVPTRLVVLPRLPLDPAGRLDRARLPAPVQAEHDGTPRTARERRLAALWCEVLDCRTATLRDHFFAGGGDSVRVMKLLERVRTEYGVAVPLPAFLTDPTLATLARLAAGPAAPQRPYTTEEAGSCA